MRLCCCQPKNSLIFVGGHLCSHLPEEGAGGLGADVRGTCGREGGFGCDCGTLTFGFQPIPT